VKFLENILHKMEPNFSKGGKFEKWNPLFETMATFAFTPKLVTQKGSHIRDGVDLKRTMMTVIIAMIPCLLFGIYNTGHFAEVAKGSSLAASYWDGFGVKFTSGLLVVLPILLVSYGVGLTVEFIFGMLRGHALHEGFLVSGMLIPLVMPADVPLWMVGVATVFAVIIGKEVFGGTGMNVVNVALTARAFLFFAYPTSMSGDKVWLSGQEVDGVSGSTALGDLASFMSDKPVFENLDAYTAKYSLMDSFMGMIPGSIGETSTMACLIGAAVLIFTGVGSLRIIASFFAGGFVMGMLLNMVGGNPYLDLPAHFHLVIGGFATGKIIYGFMGGLIAIMIRVLNPAYPEGVMLAILFMNVMAPIIDHYVIQANIKKRLKRVKTA
jgi:Na+-transporting NADH:ubiquinone oxidoreductase subunit B